MEIFYTYIIILLKRKRLEIVQTENIVELNKCEIIKKAKKLEEKGKIEKAKKKTGLNEAVRVVKGCINKVEVNGNQRITLETIVIFGDITIGKNYNESDISLLIKKLYETNFFSNLSVELINNQLIINVEGNFNTFLAANADKIGTVWNAWQTQWSGVVGRSRTVANAVSYTHLTLPTILLL